MTNTGFSDAAETWNKRFDRLDFIFGTEPNTYLANHRMLFVPGKRALCVADGEGRNSVWLAQQGLEVDAFDISAVGVAKASKLAQQAGVSVNFHVDDCDSWPWRSDAYDYVIAIFVQFADPQMRMRLFANMVKTLKPEGRLILQGYMPKQLEYKTGGPPCIDHLYTEELLRTSFDGLEILELEAYESVIQEGTQHHGLSALIGMVGAKKAVL